MWKFLVPAGFAAVLLLTGCAQTDASPEDTGETELPDFRAQAPELGLMDAAHKCATAVDRTLFLELEGISGGEGLWRHYDTELFNATVKNGEWYIEFLPTHERIAKATCHTDGTDVVPMTRIEFEEAMRGYTYENYEELVTE